MGVNGWSLEVVRGREVGRVFAIVGPAAVLGNATDGAGAINLAPQEGDSPRKMAARQAVVELRGEGIDLRDLDSPGGTFVNRQRILPGQSRPLVVGDVIQLGGVQLRVVKSGARSVDAIAYRLANGTVCRSWDDFLVVSSQKWADVRDELASGRIDTWLASIGRSDLAMPTRPGFSPDDRLDEWLGTLPLSRPARPEIDVHPSRLAIRVAPGGGTTVRTIQVSNVGDRLLRIDVRIEPAGTSWLAVADPVVGTSRAVVDSFGLSMNVAIPETLPHPLTGTLVIGGNGGSRRVEIVLETRATADPSPPPSVTPRCPIVRLSPVGRVATLALGGLLLRLLIGLAGGALGAGGMAASDHATPRLFGVAAVLATLGGLAGGWLALKRGGRSQAGFGVVSGGIAGGAFAGLAVAACRAIEPILGGMGGSTIAVGLLWAGIGVGAAMLSMVGPKGVET